MVVYTPLSLSDIKSALDEYDIGEAQVLSPLEGGTTNSNFSLKTNRGGFVLTLLEPAEEAAQIDWLAPYLMQLESRGFPVAPILPTKKGSFSCTLKNKRAIIAPLLKGREENITPETAEKAGAMLAKINLCSTDFNHAAPPPWGPEGLRKKLNQVQVTNDIAQEVTDILTRELASIKPVPNVPRGVVHTDLFPDNVLFHHGEVSGVIDFYKAGNTELAYDLAMGLLAWGFKDDTPEHTAPNTKTFTAFHKAYTKLRPLDEDEKDAMPMLLRRACCTIILMRTLRSQINASDDINSRSATAYIKRLAYFKNNDWRDLIND